MSQRKVQLPEQNYWGAVGTQQTGSQSFMLWTLTYVSLLLPISLSSTLENTGYLVRYVLPLQLSLSRTRTSFLHLFLFSQLLAKAASPPLPTLPFPLQGIFLLYFFFKTSTISLTLSFLVAAVGTASPLPFPYISTINNLLVQLVGTFSAPLTPKIMGADEMTNVLTLTVWSLLACLWEWLSLQTML